LVVVGLELGEKGKEVILWGEKEAAEAAEVVMVLVEVLHMEDLQEEVAEVVLDYLQDLEGLVPMQTYWDKELREVVVLLEH
jgi:hypothetical protein